MDTIERYEKVDDMIMRFPKLDSMSDGDSDN